MTMMRAVCVAAMLSVSTGAIAQSAKPTDPQIAHIAYTADNIDIRAGQLAQKKSTNKEVVAFANDMVRDHTAVNEKALALLKKLKVEPQDNDTSRTLTKDAEAEMKKLEGLQGAAFDKEYAQHELAFHRAVNDALRTTLIPAASNAELKELLTTGLKLFEGHQQHAEHLVSSLK